MISIIIPACNEYPQIAFALDSIAQDFRSFDHEILVIFNNNEDEAPEYLKGRGRNIRLLESDSLSCWKARSLGAKEAKGDTLFFFDAHILLEPMSVHRVLWTMENAENCGIVWMAMRYLMDTHRILYGYDLKPEKFWGNWTSHRRGKESYPLTMSGAAGFAISKEVFDAVGGYHDSFGIYGGGEPYLAFKVERFGYRNQISPDSVFAHFNARRKYSWNNDDLWRNFLIAAYSTGGDVWIKKLRNHYLKVCKKNPTYESRLDEIVAEAKALATTDHLWIEKRATLTLDEVIDRDLNERKESE